MKLAIASILAVLLLAASLPVFAGSVEPTHYFGVGPGVPDFGQNNFWDQGSSKYFYNYYPPSRWEQYGYGTGDAGMGYGPYIYGGRQVPQLAQDMPDFGLHVMKPNLKWIGGNQVRVTVPAGPGAVTQLRVDVLAWNGAVLQSATVTCPPYEVIAILPEGATNIRVSMGMSDGFNSTVIPLIPVE